MGATLMSRRGGRRYVFASTFTSVACTLLRLAARLRVDTHVRLTCVRFLNDEIRAPHVLYMQGWTMVYVRIAWNTEEREVKATESSD